MNLAAVGAWMGDNPALAAIIIWPILSAVVTALFKPRSTEEYVALAAKYPRLAKVLRLIGALGLDAPKVMQVLGDLFKVPPGKGPSGGATLVLVAGLMTLATAAAGCAGWRQDARGVLDVAQLACIAAHQALPDSDVAKACDLAGPLWGPMHDFLGVARAAAAQRMAEERRLDEQRARAGCGGYRDGGAQ